MQVTQICLKMSKILSFQKEGIYVLSTLQFFPLCSVHSKITIYEPHKYMHMHTPVHNLTHCEFPLYNYKHTENITKEYSTLVW
jgi:hypothetical protein